MSIIQNWTILVHARCPCLSSHSRQLDKQRAPPDSPVSIDWHSRRHYRSHGEAPSLERFGTSDSLIPQTLSPHTDIHWTSGCFGLNRLSDDDGSLSRARRTRPVHRLVLLKGRTALGRPNHRSTSEHECQSVVAKGGTGSVCPKRPRIVATP